MTSAYDDGARAGAHSRRGCSGSTLRMGQAEGDGPHRRGAVSGSNRSAQPGPPLGNVAEDAALRVLYEEWAAAGPYQMELGPFLAEQGVRLVIPGVPLRAESSLDGQAMKEVQMLLSGGGWPKLNQRTFPTKVPVVSSVVQLHEPKAVWLAMRKAYSQANHKPAIYQPQRVNTPKSQQEPPNPL